MSAPSALTVFSKLSYSLFNLCLLFLGMLPFHYICWELETKSNRSTVLVLGCLLKKLWLYRLVINPPKKHGNYTFTIIKPLLIYSGTFWSRGIFYYQLKPTDNMYFTMSV